MIYKRVVVPLDGSPLAEGMLRFIIDIARPLDLEVALLQVVKAAPPYLTETMKALVLENAERSLAEARAYLAELGEDLSAKGIRVRIEVRRGDPVDEIVACARAIDADLIAMTTNGRSHCEEEFTAIEDIEDGANTLFLAALDLAGRAH